MTSLSFRSVPTAFALLIASLVTFAVPSTARAELENGKPVPDFSLPDSAGKKHSLKDADIKGKIVVLEWTNYRCPFVRKHYDSKNMQKLQENAKADGIVWISIISSRKGKEGYLAPKDLEKAIAKEGTKAAFVLIDDDSAVGHLFDAKTTPHMFVIDNAGMLAYQGAIDDRPSTDVSDATDPKTKNYVTEALKSVKAGTKVAEGKVKSYGCSVKY